MHESTAGPAQPMLPNRCHGPPQCAITNLAPERWRPGAGRFHAPEWNRTTTGKSPHKALNLLHAKQLRPLASDTSKLHGLADASEIPAGSLRGLVIDCDDL